VLAIILWHMYHVHIRESTQHVHRVYGEQEMLHEHPGLADIKPALPTAGHSRRSRAANELFGRFTAS
jgi:hypothetical protein